MKKASRLFASFAALGIAISACGDDAVNPNNATLEQAEALEIGGTIVGFGFLALAQAFAMPSPPMAAPPITPLDLPCTSGSGQATGDLTDNGSGAYDAALNVNLNACGISTTSGGSYAVTASSLAVTGSGVTISTGNVGMQGSFNYSGDLSGSCNIDFTIGLQGTVSGMICGFDFNQSGF